MTYDDLIPQDMDTLVARVKKWTRETRLFERISFTDLQLETYRTFGSLCSAHASGDKIAVRDCLGDLLMLLFMPFGGVVCANYGVEDCINALCATEFPFDEEYASDDCCYVGMALPESVMGGENLAVFIDCFANRDKPYAFWALACYARVMGVNAEDAFREAVGKTCPNVLPQEVSSA